MRNLYIYEHREFSFPGLNVTSGKEEQCLFSVDPNQARLYVHADGVVNELSLNENTSRTLFNSNKFYSRVEDVPSLVGLCYLSVTDSLSLAFDNGDLLNINCVLEGEIECVGTLESGLRLMEWSPDQDVAVLLTANDTLIIISGTFDVINQTALQQKQFGENQFITVGWGKKETQFHGSEGKAAAKIKPIEQPVSDSIYDKGFPQICWRGDGSLFGINCVNKETGHRFIRVFNRQGDLQYTSEHISGLEGVISWRPSGNLMACTQLLPNKHVVCFIEKNGLKHGEFTLPFPIHSTYVRQLLWNAESTILLVWCEAVEESSLPGLAVGQNSFLLWTVNNYHWYLKLRIDLNYVPVAVAWDQLSGSRLHILCPNALYVSYEFSWRVDHSQGVNCNDEAFVAVIDGDAVLLTSFRHSVIPPPMCGSTLKLPSQASEIIFAPGGALPTYTKCSDRQGLNHLKNALSAENLGKGESVGCLSSSSNNICVLLSNGLIAAFSYPGRSHAPNESHIPIGTYQLKWECGGDAVPHHQLHHWSWVARDLMMCSATVNCNSFLCFIDMEFVGSPEKGLATVWKQIPLENTVLSITSGGNGKRVLIQLSDQTVLQYNFEDDSLSPLMSLPQPAVQLIICNVADTSNNMTEIIVSLTGHNRLYVDNVLVKNNATSLAIHSQFLLLTTSQHELLCCPLKKSSILDLSKSKEGKPNDSEDIVASRRVERGSRLVVAVPESNRVILQMPRGNLECIQPRALSLYQIAVCLNSSLYHEAFDLARKQRINLNLLIDHDPSLFLQNVDLFVKHVANAQWLSLFLAELEADDCTTSMYRAHYVQPRTSSLKDKVHTVCDAVLSAIHQQNGTEGNSSSLTIPYLTGLVRKKTLTDLEAALLVIKQLKCEDTKGVNALHWTHALRHLLYLKDVDELMDAALGMYDFDLVLLVASRSQKDPKEFLAFLNNLQSMEINYQRFSIDKHLRKWESALSHLILCPQDHTAELLEFIKSYDLYRTALHLLPKNDERFKKVAGVYADKLKVQRLYKEAGVMYRRACDYSSALQANLKALEWQACIQDAGKVDLSNEDQKELLRDLSSALVDAHRCSEAAIIQDTYLNEPQEAIKTLCTGSHWKEAVRIASDRGHTNSIENVVIPSAIESCKKLLNTIKMARDQFILHKDRLKEVRIEKEKSRELQCLDDPDLQGESDLFSDTSSVISGSSTTSKSSNLTSSSTRSSKNRRKQERKILSLKKGSRFEELALIRALHQEISDTFALRGDVYCVNCFLVDNEIDGSASELQEELSITLKLLESSFTEIWPVCSSENSFMQGPLATSNMIALSMASASANQLDMSLLEPQFRFSPIIRPVSWELSFLRSSGK